MDLEQKTITYIAKPEDSKCKWWSAILPPDLSEENLTERLELHYLKSGDDLELYEGQMIIDSESNHEWKPRGFRVVLGVAFTDLNGVARVRFLSPTLSIKNYIKKTGGQSLMKGSGDIAGVVRMALWLKSQPNLCDAYYILSNLKD